VITKVLFSAATALAALVMGVGAAGLAAPAGADPSAFGVLSCSCHEGAPAVGADQTNLGIQSGIADLAPMPGSASR
jgi:hypothetical protein